MKRFLLIPIFVLLSLAVACRPQQDPSAAAMQPAGQDPRPLPAPTEEAPAPTAQMAEVDELLLLWEGVPAGEGVSSETCGRLEIRAGGQASFGPCDGSPTTTSFTAPYWEEMVARFGSFTMEQGEGQLHFQGRGTIDGVEWQRAVANWARTTYGELASGRACAACRTILTWSFGPLPADGERCAILWATDFGYAYQGTVPCEGGQTEITAEGWLTTPEWAQLETWLRTQARLTLGDKGETSLLAQGTEETNEAKQAALALWSDDVAARLQRQFSQTEGSASLVPVDVQHVQVEVGVGSPIPVDVVVAGLWPGLCTQLAEVKQNMTGFAFEISLLADAGLLDCPPDHVGLSFRIAIPINVAELPEGTYTVTVNGMNATFDVPVRPTVPVDPQTGAPIEPDPGGGQALALCPEVPRPALALFLPGEGYLITDPLSGAACKTTLDGDVPGLFQAVGDALYYTVLEDEQFVVKRLGQDAVASLLPFTAVDRDDALLYHSFVVSPDGQRIAWSAASTPGGQIWAASMDGTAILSPLPELQAGGTDEQPRVLVPVRFSEDGSTLFMTRQLVDIGGIWSAYAGRYDNLYAWRLDDDASPALIFDCPDEQVTLCIGDFEEVQGQVQILAYVAPGSVVIVDGTSEVLNRIEFDADYVGYPTFGPEGQLAIYSAEGTTTITSDEGAIYLVDAPAEASAAAELLVSGPNIFLPKDWLDAGHLVIAYHGADDNWHTVVVDGDGLMVAPASMANAIFVDVLPATRHEGARPGGLHTTVQTIELGDVDAVTVEIQTGGGELEVSGGASELLEASFIYSVEALNPRVTYASGRLIVKDGGVNPSNASLPDLAEYRSEWDLKLNEDVPMEMKIALGTGPSTLALGALTLTRLSIEGGAGPVTLDLSGERQDDLNASIAGGLGPLNLRLPGNVGVSIEVKNESGPIAAGELIRVGNTYTTNSYEVSEVALRIVIEDWAGPINLDLE